MSPARVLLVEDEKDLQELMMLQLKREGHVVDTTEDGDAALKLLEANEYDMAILDWMVPGTSGIKICQKIDRKIPVLMVTARAESNDIVLGLEMGADDYLTKPFEISVFIARVRALLRRTYFKEQNAKTFQIGALFVDLEKHIVKCGEEIAQLTPSEFKLLGALVENQGRVLSREKLIDLVQGVGVVVVDRAIDTHIFGLRKKLGDCGDFVETIRGVGYRIKIN